MENKILNFINSVEFQELNSYYNEKTIFGALNVERNEKIGTISALLMMYV